MIRPRHLVLMLAIGCTLAGVSRAGDQKTIVGGFKSVSGMDSETEVVERQAAGKPAPGGKMTSGDSDTAPGAAKPSGDVQLKGRKIRRN